MADDPTVLEQRRRWWLAPLVVLAATALLTVPFYLTDLDVAVARHLAALNREHGGAWQDVWYWRVAYFVPTVMALLIAGGSIVAIVLGLARPAARSGLRPALFLLLAMALGPGLIANAVLKDHWGRPRPRETRELGGKWDYRAPWVMGVAGRGKSFPSGHVTVPACGLALWLLWRRRRPGLARWCLAGGLALSAYVGAARMVAGAHYLSDVMWAVTIVFVVSALLHRLIVLVPERAQGPPTAARRPRWLVYGGSGLAAAALLAAALMATPIYRDLSAKLGPAQLGTGPWSLEIDAEDADVEIDLQPGIQPPLRASAEIQGYGWPGSTVDRTVRADGGVARVRLARRGRFLELSTNLHLIADPAHLTAIRIRLGSGDVIVRSQDPARRIPVEALTPGEVILPEGWR